jgi:hypothetical protein
MANKLIAGNRAKVKKLTQDMIYLNKKGGNIMTSKRIHPGVE